MPSGGEGGDLLCRLLFLFLCVLLRFAACALGEFRWGEAESGERFLGEVAASDEPFVSLKDVRMSSVLAVLRSSTSWVTAAAEFSFGARLRTWSDCSCPGFSDQIVWGPSGGQTNGGACRDRI